MKTFIKSSALVITALLISVNIFANGFEMETEEYIDDIPFNTQEVATNVLYQQALAEDFEMDNETYVDDIPFNTETIAGISLSLQAMDETFEMVDESYIEDIPFNTEIIAASYSDNYQTMIAKR